MTAYTPPPTDRVDAIAARLTGFQVNVSVTNNNPDTIWNRLAARLGRQPTNAEAADEVRRILGKS